VTTNGTPSSSSTEHLSTDVIIIGGGLAGLTAAIGLCESGLRVTLLERDVRLGGRACSWIDHVTGDPVHIGPHIFLSEYLNMFKLLDVLGTRDKIVWATDDMRVIRGRQEIITKLSRLPAPLHLMPSMMQDQTVSGLDKLSNVKVTLYALRLTEEDILRLDGVNASHFLRSMGVTQGSIDRFWSFASMGIMNVPVELCSAGALMRFYRYMVGKGTFEVGFADGGLGDLFAPAAKAMIEAHHGEVLLSTEVKRLLGDAHRITGVELSDGRVLTARFYVAALPPPALRRIVRSEWIERYDVFHDLVHFLPSPYISVFLWFDRKLTNLQCWARFPEANDLNTDFYDLSNIHRGWADRPSLICSNIIYSERASHLADDEVVARTVAELSEYIPDAAEARVVHRVVNRIPMAIHCPFPGMERRRPPVQTPVRGLTLAGDWLRTRLPSSMESACKAGFLAAEEILAAIGKPEQLAVEHSELDLSAVLLGKLARLLPVQQKGL
jgi:15-cis-phytoene desaturase